MAKPERDPLVESLVGWLKIGGLYLAGMYVIPAAILVALLASALAETHPIVLAVVIAILVLIGIAGALGYFYLRRKFAHYLTARRADRENAAYLKGEERGIHGKYQPENLE